MVHSDKLKSFSESDLFSKTFFKKRAKTTKSVENPEKAIHEGQKQFRRHQRGSKEDQQKFQAGCKGNPPSKYLIDLQKNVAFPLLLEPELAKTRS